MNINYFTEKFHEIEIDARAFEFQDIDGLHYWDAVRYSVFQYTYECLLDQRTNFDTKTGRKTKVKLRAKLFISRCIQYLVINLLKYSKNIGVLVKRQYLEITTEVKKDHQQISW